MVDFEGTSLDSIRQMVSIGMGLSLFPELCAQAEFHDADNVKLLELEDWIGCCDVGFCWLESSRRQRDYKVLVAESGASASAFEISLEQSRAGLT